MGVVFKARIIQCFYQLSERRLITLLNAVNKVVLVCNKNKKIKLF